MHVYLIRYALSSGIERIEGEIADGGYFSTKVNGMFQCYPKGDWALTEEEAAHKAGIKRDKKIASLKKQIEKLEKLTF